MKNKKGFTLIELLAVIVILGLLMAIAIPGVTRYITESRKKTLVSTVDSYTRSLLTSINNGEYRFSDSSIVHAVPIECIPLEKGGDNPFGEWIQANNNYWAYVLVHYNSEEYTYEYGFTFKDSAGYSMYPTELGLIDGTYVRNGLTLSKPKDGKITETFEIDKWNGFTVNENTRLNVLNATKEGGVGDGYNTCTLVRKGNNYEEIQASEKDKILVPYSAGNYFWAYRDQIKTITFQNAISVPENAFKSWDVSTTGNGYVMAYLKVNSSNPSYYDLYIQGEDTIYANKNSASYFSDFVNLDSINNFSFFDTSKATSMGYMFSNCGKNSSVFTLDLGNSFDTSNVTNMTGMFHHAGYSSPLFTLNLGDKFDTSKVTTMSYMFYNTGYNSLNMRLNLGNKFDTSKVVDMGYMFYNVGRNSPVFTLNLGDKFDTSSVTNMHVMFFSVGRSNTTFTINLGNKFDTSNVTNMYGVFQQMGLSSTVLTLDLGDKFDTSKATNMYGMFESVGNKSPVFTLDLGDKFDTSNVTDMAYMFRGTGSNSSNFYLDCRSWNVDNVIKYANFNASSTSKVIPPIWVN